MIVVGQTPQPDAALKILTPWWDVLARYLTAGIMTIALTATALQAAKDNLICMPAVNCTNVSSQLSNQSTTAKIHTDVCRKADNVALRNDVVTTMADRRQYDFVDSACFQKTLKWYPAYFPFVLVVEAVILIVIDNFWIMYPKTSSALNHFVVLVMECYSSVGTLSAILKVIKKTEKGSEGSEKQSEEEDSSKVLKVNVEDIEMSSMPNPHQEREPDPIPFDIDEAMKVKTLYEKIEEFRQWYETTHVLLNVYVLRGIFQILFSLSVLIFNLFFYEELSESVECHLDVVFLTKYEFFLCSRFIAPYYQAITIVFLIPIGIYLITSLFSFCWTFNNSTRFNLYSGVEFVDDKIDIKGDLAFVFSLLEQYNKLYSTRLSLFLSKGNKEKIEIKINTYSDSKKDEPQSHFLPIKIPFFS